MVEGKYNSKLWGNFSRPSSEGTAGETIFQIHPPRLSFIFAAYYCATFLRKKKTGHHTEKIGPGKKTHIAPITTTRPKVSIWPHHSEAVEWNFRRISYEKCFFEKNLKNLKKFSPETAFSGRVVAKSASVASGKHPARWTVFRCVPVVNYSWILVLSEESLKRKIERKKHNQVWTEKHGFSSRWSGYCTKTNHEGYTVFTEINAHHETSAHPKPWVFKGGSTQNRWALVGEFSKGGVHKTDGLWWVIFQRGEYTKPMGFDGWVLKGGSTQNRWGLMGDFSKGGVHKTDGLWWVSFQRGEYIKPMVFDGRFFKGGSTQNRWLTNDRVFSVKNKIRKKNFSITDMWREFIRCSWPIKAKEKCHWTGHYYVEFNGFQTLLRYTSKRILQNK